MAAVEAADHGQFVGPLAFHPFLHPTSELSMSIQKSTLEQVKRAGAALVDARKALANDFKGVMDQMASAIITQPAGRDLDRQFASVKDLARLAHDMASLEERVKDILVSAMALVERGAGGPRTLHRSATPRLLGTTETEAMVVDVVASVPKAQRTIRASSKSLAPTPPEEVTVKASPKTKSPAGEPKVAPKGRQKGGQENLQKRGAFRTGVKAAAKPVGKTPVKSAVKTPTATPAPVSEPVPAAAPAPGKGPTRVAKKPEASKVSVKGAASKTKVPAKPQPSPKAAVLAKTTQPSEPSRRRSAETQVPKAASNKPVGPSSSLSGNESKVLAFVKTRLSKKKPTALTGKVVAEGAGVPAGSVSSALKQLVAKGRLVFKGEGMYLLG